MKKLLVVLLLFLTACSAKPAFELYHGQALKIAVVGTAPDLQEGQVQITEISFEEMSQDNLREYDAVIITKENLHQAAENQYADVYTNSSIPFFFISATSHIPFILKDVPYDESWNWSPGNPYASGYLTSANEDGHKTWGLYNDELNNENLSDLYSRIFQEIDEFKEEY